MANALRSHIESQICSKNNRSYGVGTLIIQKAELEGGYALSKPRHFCYEAEALFGSPQTD